MLRRHALLLACSAIPASCLPAAYTPPVVSTEADDEREQQTVEELAKTLAQIELAAIKEAHPDDWQSLSYVADVRVREDLTAIYCVTSNTKLIDWWAGRVEHAMYPGKLRVHALGKAGQIPDKDDGYNYVTLLICNSQSVELERVAFLDLKAKYPEPKA